MRHDLSEKLTDPNKAAHEIVKKLPYGAVMRNDGVQLTAANRNPWYVLATIYGEYEKGDDPSNIMGNRVAKNRRAWNGWYCADLTEAEREDRAEKTGLKVKDLLSLDEEELAEVVEKFRERMDDMEAKLPERTEKIYFSETYFSNAVNFDRYVFEKPTYFSSSTFCEDAHFNSAVFGGPDFGSVVFNGRSSFGSASFGGFAYFGSAVFIEFSHFGSAMFNGTNFVSAMFTERSSFRSAECKGNAGFNSVVFSGIADFSSITIGAAADFGTAVFGSLADFRSATFCRQANFKSAKFSSTALFENAKFYSSVPQFHGADMYDETIFPASSDDLGSWPPLSELVYLEGQDKPVRAMRTGEQKRAYNRLRLFMNRSLQIDEEQFFHWMEMRCKRETEDWRYRWIYTLFEGASDYGNSVLRPAGWLFVIWLSGAIAKLEAAKGAWYPDWSSIPQAMGWSFANLFSFFGFYRKYFHGEDLNAALQLFSGVQTVLGFALLFFLGLGLRNRFRLR